MDTFKKNQYVILLLVVILFVSLSFSVVLNLPLREGLTCLPTCDNVNFDSTTGEIPKCKKYISKSLKPEDAKVIMQKCINPFIKDINAKMNHKYNYNKIRKTLYKTNTFYQSQPQKELNAYFTDVSCVSTQDIMDKLTDNVDSISKSPVFQKKNISSIINEIKRYKADRETPSSDIKHIYNKLITCVDKESDMINNRCVNYYVDENLNTLIDDVKEAPSYYGFTSSFHKLRSYILDGVNNKLEPQD